MRKLLKDDVFRRWMTKPPRKQGRWRLYVLPEKGGSWYKKDVGSYGEGYRLLAENIREWHDVSLTCMSTEFRPPVVRVPHTRDDGVETIVRKYHVPMISVPYHHWC